MTTAASLDALECRADELTVGDILLDGPQPAHVTAICTLTDTATGAGYVRITARHYDVYGETEAFTFTQRANTVHLIALHDDGSDVDPDTDGYLGTDGYLDIESSGITVT
ncbi:hypothetical protein CYJ73_21245 [Gordonia terrae]|uniref:Uncharacterized protein n=1 Tax=Gordonia terrae TaxID=2055 RepID=A0A2I1R394_9ACTN|nr:hypothetical protein [Gordonia terrae]PKZ63590.1 hypothetical protein CYJ73_21245 [Gordonia terrae]